ncbi:transmembrane protein 131 isoform X2 [Cephus cinctus]|uniref:Transmembrane protein 131 isoform X2 n=1 Tax=Cephus cinctus TaxID=211228 RepID=A0AAJ7C157_CEPCN|nr:transmembrane protein 131 isoform X2 [Cephus cinctus]
MRETNVRRCLLFLAFIHLAYRVNPTSHGHNNAFVQGDNDVQYLLENIPISMHKGFTNSVDGTGDPILEENSQDSLAHIQFEPNILDFKERQLGVPHQETVTLFNRDENRTIHLSAISGNTQHFHSSFFQDKVIPPLGNTSFNVVFLGREEGEIDSHLFIHTSDGMLKYQVKGISISSPYRLRPVVGVKLPLNASFTPLIYMHNPHAEAMQVVEIYSSGGEFQLELPSGQSEGPRELWEIPPYQTKPVIRLRFNAYTEKNHTAYVRFKVNNSAEVLVVTVEVEVSSGAGLHWGGSSGVVNFGMGGSLQPPIHYPIALKNSAKKSVKVLNVISTPVSKALKINFEPVVIPGDTEIPISVGTLVYDWKAGLDLQHFKGKLMIKGVGPGGSSQKLAIPWIAEVLPGGLEVNTSVTHYCSPFSSQPRNFSVVNKFRQPLAITNVSLSSEAKSLFTIKNFIPRVLKPGQKVNIFSLLLTNERKSENPKLESSILIHSNVSTTEVPLLSYDGKVRKIIPGEREADKGTMNFGTVGSGTENEAVFALENQNPINIELHGWGVNMPGAVLELMGCQSGPTDLFNKGFRNITVCSQTGNQNIKPGYLAIFKIKVKTPNVEEDTIVGDVFVRTTYERLTVPVYMRVAHGRISLKKLTFTDCFPGAICMQQVKVHSTFTRPMEVTFIAPVQKDDRIKYVPLEETTLPVISKGENHVGSIAIDPLITCKNHCYLGLCLNTSAGSQWLNTINLPSHTRDSDLNLLNTRYSRYLNSTGGGSWDNITMRLDTTEVRGHKFFVNIKPYWPSLLGNSGNSKNRSLVMFPLTQVGNTSYKSIKIHNPSSNSLLVQLVMDWSYPQGMRLYHSLPNKFKPICLECPSTIPNEFKLEDIPEDRELFQRTWNTFAPVQSLPLYLSPNQSKTVRISYTPSMASSSSTLLYVRNNMTILEVVRLVGRGAHAQFKFGNRKPGSTTPLLFELADRHLKDCERERLRRNPVPNLTVKRSFTARNTGELSIDIHGFYISGLRCEGYGFKVLNCSPFKLNPNATRKIDIAFTPDFTLSRIERELLILTSLGDVSEDVNENGVARLTLLTTVPSHFLESCAGVLVRPSWERAIHWAAITLAAILLTCILAVSFLEADRILRGTLANLARASPVQPPLDLRLLAKEKDERTRSASAPCKKDDHLDWSIMNVKKKDKEKDSKGIKIPDWTPEEERRFRMDTENKEPSFKKDEDSASNGSKKKNGKRQSSGQDHENFEGLVVQDNLISCTVEKKPLNTLKSSPTSNRRSQQNSKSNSTKEESKPVDEEVVVDTISSNFINPVRENKMENKRKQTTSNGNSHVPYKKFDTNPSQKIVQFSEEETSSTTTESSTHDDPVPFKDCERSYSKPEKIQRKPMIKKTKQQNIQVVPSIDYRDNYEGDCDDDDYDKERHENPNRWKTNTNRTTTKHHHHQSRCNAELSFKLPRQIKNPPRKEKASQKRRATEKTHSKTLGLNGNLSQRDEMRQPQPTLPSPLPPPPSCWNENRAKFSDVVARNPEAISPTFSGLNKPLPTRPISHDITGEFSTEANVTGDCLARPSARELIQPNVKTLLGHHSQDKLEKQDGLFAQSNPHANSYFINTFNEPPFEPKLVPFTDLPEHNGNLVDTNATLVQQLPRNKLWNNDSLSMNILPDKTNNAFDIDSSNTADQITNFLDALNGLSSLTSIDISSSVDNPASLDNWVTVETNWEPLYTRGAVGEERSGAWGVNTGGVWAAAPWGAPTPPSSELQPSTALQQTETDVQERSGFDPFRSLSTIWTPSSTDSWKPKEGD